jgi:GNAT superfamily N-acetyltransferase
MPADAGLLEGDGVRLLPVAPDEVDEVLRGALHGYHAGRAWPHADTGPALAFTAMGGQTWLVVDETGAVVGELGTKAPPEETGAVEIGYGLAAPSRGHGLGTRAVATLLAWLDAQPEISLVVARVDAANEPSLRLLERLGFTCTDAPDDGERRYERRPPVDGRKPDMRW